MSAEPWSQFDRRLFVVGLGAALGACVAPTAAVRTSAHIDVDRLRGGLAQLVAEHGLPGVIVGLTVRGRREFVAAGVASREARVPVSADTIFEIGSLSKLFTAIAGGYALAQGTIRLDDTVARYLPELAGAPIGNAHLIDLATYSAGGLPLQFPDNVRNDVDALAYLRHWQPEAVIGKVRRYSNPSIGLFGHAVARSLHLEFKSLLEGTIIPELGLTSTFIDVPDAEEARYAWGYDDKDQAVRVNPGPFDAEAYGIKTSAADLLRFLELFMNPGLVAPTIRSALQSVRHPYYRVGPLQQCLGWERYDWPTNIETLLAGNSSEIVFGLQEHTNEIRIEPGAQSLFSKTGSTGGFGAYVACVPELQTGLMILANRNYSISDRLSFSLNALQEYI